MLLHARVLPFLLYKIRKYVPTIIHASSMRTALAMLCAFLPVTDTSFLTI